MVDQISLPKHDELRRVGLEVGSQLNGLEGISLLVGRSEVIAPDLWSVHNHNSYGEKGERAGDPNSSLLLQFGSESDQSLSARQASKPRVFYRRLLELPLANTVFQNGHSSTFFAQRWRLGPELHCVKHQDLQQQQICLPDCGGKLEEKFCLPLNYLPLTSPQTVATSWGNIISQFRSEGDSGATEHASLQLEGVISSRSTLQEASHEIWARIIPREFWPDRPHMIRGPEEAFWYGHRLHRVLSGGGGWGNKRGLLSLDPDSTFYGRDSESGLARESQDPVKVEERDILGEIVRPGDVIDLWMCSDERPCIRPRKEFPKSSRPVKIFRSKSSFCFGHSAFEEERRLDNPIENKSQQVPSQYLAFERHFGAISFSGLSLHIKSLSSEQGCTVGSLKVGTIVQSKIPPGGHFRLQSWPMDVSRKVINAPTSSIESSGSESKAVQHPPPSDIPIDQGLRITRVHTRPPSLPYHIHFDNEGKSKLFYVQGQNSTGKRKRILLDRNSFEANLGSDSVENSGSLALADKLQVNPHLRLEDALQALALPEKEETVPQEPWGHSSSAEPIFSADIESANSPGEIQLSSSGQAESIGRSRSSREPGNSNSALDPSESTSEILAYLRDANAEKEAHMRESEEFFGSGNFRPERENLGRPEALGGVDKRNESNTS